MSVWTERSRNHSGRQVRRAFLRAHRYIHRYGPHALASPFVMRAYNAWARWQNERA